MVNYQSYADTIGCVESILKSQQPDYRIFIVDNSFDRQLQPDFLVTLSAMIFGNNENHVKVFSESDFGLQEETGLITVVNAKNRGFAAANNVVLKQILLTEKYSYIWLLNNDTKIFPHTIAKYISAHKDISTQKKLGMLGCLLVYEDEPSLIQGAGGLYYKFLGLTSHLLDGRALANFDHSTHQKIDYPIGASMLVSLAFLKDVGLLDESYFLYFEEIDWVIRGKKKGWVCDYTSDVYIYHKAGGTIGGKNKLKKKSSALSDYYFYRNRLKFSYQHTPLHFPFVLLTVGASVIYRIFRRRASFLKLFLKKGG